MYQRAGIPPSVDGTLSTVIEISKSLSDAYRFRQFLFGGRSVHWSLTFILVVGRSRSSDGTRQHSPVRASRLYKFRTLNVSCHLDTYQI